MAYGVGNVGAGWSATVPQHAPVGEEAEILTKIQVEYAYGYQYINPKRVQNLQRLRLYQNQRKDVELVGDTTLFTIFQTVLTKLYEDRLSAVFAPTHPDDTNKVSELAPLQEFDFRAMKMEQIEYDWDWYTLFWGSGFLDVSVYDTKKKLLLPSVVDNATLLIDPDGTYVNGDARGLGAFRFWGREIALTKKQMEARGFKNYQNLTVDNNYQSLTYDDKQYRALAQNTGTPDQSMSYVNSQKPAGSDLIPCLEWWTWHDGKRMVYTVDLQFQNILKTLECPYDYWPLMHRKLFPIPHDALGVSIPDLVEDKQRARSILINLNLASAKADLYPMYVYDRNVISPTNDFSFKFNKFIPADGPVNAAIAPLQKPGLSNAVSYVMDVINQAAQQATAATSLIQGVQSDTVRSANETVRAFNQAEERITTSARIFGWSERDFWYHWLNCYQMYFNGGKSKFVQVSGPYGPSFKKFTVDNFDFSEMVDIKIESKILNDAANQDASNRLLALSTALAQDQSVNRRYLNQQIAKVTGGMTQSQIDVLFPPTADEMKAEDENIRLDDNKIQLIAPDDDHYVHLMVHMRASTTKAQILHVEAHKRALLLQRQQQKLTQADGANPSVSPTSTQVQPNLTGTGSAPAASVGQQFSVKS